MGPHALGPLKHGYVPTLQQAPHPGHIVRLQVSQRVLVVEMGWAQVTPKMKFLHVLGEEVVGLLTYEGLAAARFRADHRGGHAGLADYLLALAALNGGDRHLFADHAQVRAVDPLIGRACFRPDCLDDAKALGYFCVYFFVNCRSVDFDYLITRLHITCDAFYQFLEA